MNAYLSAGCAISPLFANTVITTTEKWYVNVEYAACTVENKSINAASTIDIQISAEIYNSWLSFEAKLVSRQLLNKYEESFFFVFFENAVITWCLFWFFGNLWAFLLPAFMLS